VYAFFCAISMVGIEAPSIRLKALRLPPVIEDRHVLANAKFSGFLPLLASTIFCASSEEMLYFFTTFSHWTHSSLDMFLRVGSGRVEGRHRNMDVHAFKKQSRVFQRRAPGTGWLRARDWSRGR